MVFVGTTPRLGGLTGMARQDIISCRAGGSARTVYVEELKLSTGGGGARIITIGALAMAKLTKPILIVKWGPWLIHPQSQQIRCWRPMWHA